MPTLASRVPPWLTRSSMLAGLWLVLAGPSTRSWPLIALVIAIAAYVSLRTLPPTTFRLTWGGLLRFLPFFLRYSIRGGLDVALRAVRLEARIDPGTVEFSTRLPPGSARTFFAAVIGLLPGTLTAQLEGEILQVHLIDRRVDVGPQLGELEARVADLFGQQRI